MIGQQDSAATQPLTLQDQRLFLKLPLEERRHRLAKQADEMAELYQQQANANERSEWQGGDITE